MPWVAARARRWLYADREVCTARASRSAPTTFSGIGCAAYGRPSTVTVPDDGASRPRISRMVVDLPAPFGPRKPVTMPGRTENVRSWTATFSPYFLVNPSASIMSRPSFRCCRR